MAAAAPVPDDMGCLRVVVRLPPRQHASPPSAGVPSTSPRTPVGLGGLGSGSPTFSMLMRTPPSRSAGGAAAGAGGAGGASPFSFDAGGVFSPRLRRWDASPSPSPRPAKRRNPFETSLQHLQQVWTASGCKHEATHELNGEVTCILCGEVQYEDRVQVAPEWRTFAEDGGPDPSRVGAPQPLVAPSGAQAASGLRIVGPVSSSVKRAERQLFSAQLPSKGQRLMQDVMHDLMQELACNEGEVRVAEDMRGHLLDKECYKSAMSTGRLAQLDALVAIILLATAHLRPAIARLNEEDVARISDADIKRVEKLYNAFMHELRSQYTALRTLPSLFANPGVCSTVKLLPSALLGGAGRPLRLPLENFMGELMEATQREGWFINYRDVRRVACFIAWNTMLPVAAPKMSADDMQALRLVAWQALDLCSLARPQFVEMQGRVIRAMGGEGVVARMSRAAWQRCARAAGGTIAVPVVQETQAQAAAMAERQPAPAPKKQKQKQKQKRPPAPKGKKRPPPP